MVMADKSAGEIIDRLHLCQCGQPELAIQVIREVLELFDRPAHNDPDREAKWNAQWERIKAWIGEDDPYRWFIVYVLDSWGLMDQGTSILGGWINEDGETLLSFLRQTNCDRDAWSEEWDRYLNQSESDRRRVLYDPRT